MDMRSKLSQRAGGITPSITLVISAKAKKMQEEGTNIINFSIGEPDMGTPDYICDAAKRALDEGKTRYTPSAGILPLRKGICDKLARENGLKYEPSQIVVSNGAKHSLANAIAALVNDGDEVIIPAPYWITYPELVKLSGGKPVIVETAAADGFKLTPKKLSSALTARTKAIIINSPCNPTGAVYTRAELDALAAVILKHDIFVISDEIYEKLNYSGEPHYSIAQHSNALKERTIVVNGMSKSFAMTGWRMGYTAAHPDIAKAIDGLQSHMTSNINTVTQYASLAALEGLADGGEGAKLMQKMIETFNGRRKYMLDRLAKIPRLSFIKPDGAFYVMVKYPSSFGTGVQFAETLLDKAQIAVVPGEAFGAPGLVRFSYTLSLKDIEEGMNRFEKFLEECK